MGDIANRAIVIAVGIFVTMAITSGILLSINEIKNIYQKVYETDTNITSRFSEFDAFDNTEKTGLEVANTINKYKENTTVQISLSGTSHSKEDFLDVKKRIKDNTYSELFSSTISIDDRDWVTIIFKKK